MFIYLHYLLQVLHKITNSNYNLTENINNISKNSILCIFLLFYDFYKFKIFKGFYLFFFSQNIQATYLNVFFFRLSQIFYFPMDFFFFFLN